MEYVIMRVLLMVYALGALVLSIFYLRYRNCKSIEFALWGIIALLLPVIGPFLVIAAQPGPRRRVKRASIINRPSPSPKG